MIRRGYYVGPVCRDIGDYGKLGLLRVLRRSGLSLGVNWYLVPNEHHNGDGRFIDYDDIKGCDEALWKDLSKVAKLDPDKRKVSLLEDMCILDARYYSERLDFKNKSKLEREEVRKKWHEKAVKKLKGTDIVFVDPDNGMLVSSADGTMKENKYARPEEIAEYYDNGSSVVYYQHKARRSDDFYRDQHIRLAESIGIDRDCCLGMKFIRTSLRYYFFLIQPEYKDMIDAVIVEMMAAGWDKCFKACKF